MSIVATKVDQIDHVNIVVDDLNKMTQFYRDVLGMEQYKEATITGEWVDSVVGLRKTVADVVFLRLGSGSNLELIQYRNPNGDRPAHLASPNTKGIRHMAFRVHDIEELVETIGQTGVKFVSSVQVVPTQQVAVGDGIRKRLVYFHDPEGNLLELCSYEV